MSKSLSHATARLDVVENLAALAVAMIFPLPIVMPLILVAGNVVIGGIYIVGELLVRLI